MSSYGRDKLYYLERYFNVLGYTLADGHRLTHLVVELYKGVGHQVPVDSEYVTEDGFYGTCRLPTILVGEAPDGYAVTFVRTSYNIYEQEGVH